MVGYDFRIQRAVRRFLIQQREGDFLDFLTLGIDIGGTNFRIGMVDGEGQISGFEKSSSRIFDSGNVVETMANEIELYLARYAVQNRVKAVGVGIPSLVSKDKRTIVSTPNLKGFDKVNFASELEKRLSMPVYLDRDVNFLLQNDISALKLDMSKTILGFYVGTGFGNALYIEGRFYSGKNGAAGELGHIPLFGNDELCTCGNRGCSEVRCSGKYLEQLCERYFPTTPIRFVFNEHPNDPVLLDYVRTLAIPIATEINILDPDYIILAGGVLYMQDFPKDVLIEAIHEKTRKPFPESNLDIRFSEHNQQSGVYGSGEFARLMVNKRLQWKR